MEDTTSSQCSSVYDNNGKSIYPNLSLSVVLLKLTGLGDSISPEWFWVKPVIPDSRLLFTPQITNCVCTICGLQQFITLRLFLKLLSCPLYIFIVNLHSNISVFIIVSPSRELFKSHLNETLLSDFFISKLYTISMEKYYTWQPRRCSVQLWDAICFGQKEMKLPLSFYTCFF